MVSDPKRRPARAVAAALVACTAALAGCGIKGPLRLPESTPGATAAPVNAPARSDDPAVPKSR